MNRSPLILAIVLLLLPLLYVGSYLALLKPRSVVHYYRDADELSYPDTYRYWCGGHALETVFWPLEQIDRRIRPRAWGRQFHSIQAQDFMIE